MLKVIDNEFNFLGTVDDYESFLMTRSFFGIGGFELKTNYTPQKMDILQDENILFKDDKKAYIILHQELDSAENIMLIRGVQLKQYAARWVTKPPIGQAYDRQSGSPESIMKSYVSTNCGIPNLIVASSQNRGETMSYQTRYKNLAEELETIGVVSGLGWDIRLDLDNNKFIFEVYEGLDRTANQTENPPAIFSDNFDNVGKQYLTRSKLDYKNVAIVGGQGEGADRTIVTVGDAQGFERYETFIDARDLENENDLPERGEQRLAEIPKVNAFESDILANSNLKYEEDFDLGDMVVTQNKVWKVTQDTRINEITEIYEAEGFKLDAVFGNPLPTLLKKLKAEITNSSSGGTDVGSSGSGSTSDAFIGKLSNVWASENPILVKNSVGIEEDTRKLKIGDGVTRWNSLPYMTQGATGKSIEYVWNGTQLGIRVEGSPNYDYTDLKGTKGDSFVYSDFTPAQLLALKGSKGDDGKDLEFTWNGTQLGVRKEGQTTYQYTDLKGAKGDAFVYSDFTQAQLDALKGPKGDAGTIDNLTAGSNIEITGTEIATKSYPVFEEVKVTYPDYPAYFATLYDEGLTFENPDGSTTIRNNYNLNGIVDIEFPKEDGVLMSSDYSGINGTYSDKKVNMANGIIDLLNGNTFLITVNNNLTFTFLNPNATSGIKYITLIITMGATARTLTFPASVKWHNDEIPDLTLPNKRYIITFAIFSDTFIAATFGGAFSV